MRRLGAVLWLMLVAAIAPSASGASEPPRWSGVDDVIEQRLAAQAGRPASKSEADSGLGRFYCLLAGALAGFVAGYSFRTLFPPRRVVARRDGIVSTSPSRSTEHAPGS